MKRIFKTSLSIFLIRAAEVLQYRLAAFSGTTVSAFWALIEVTVITVFFTYGNNTSYSFNGLNLSQAVSYIWIGQMFVMLQSPSIDGDLIGKIINGDVGVELCRPIDLYWHWFAKSAAGKVNAFVLRGGGVIVVGAVLKLIGFSGIGLSAPFFPYFFLLLLSICSAFLFCTSYGMFLTAIRMNISWGDGPINLIAIIGMVLSGGYLPLQLWPDALQNFLRLQPFASSLDTPAKLYVGSIPLSTAITAVLLQFLWIIVFVFLGRLIMRCKLKNIIVQGG